MKLCSLYLRFNAQKWSFPLRISSVNATKSAVSFIFCAMFIWNEFPNPMRKIFCTFLEMSTKNLASFQQVAEAYLEPSQPSMMELLFTKSSITGVWLGSKNVSKLLKTNLLRQCLNKYYDVYLWCLFKFN